MTGTLRARQMVKDAEPPCGACDGAGEEPTHGSRKDISVSPFRATWFCRPANGSRCKLRRASRARNKAARWPPRPTRRSAGAICGRRDAVMLAKL